MKGDMMLGLVADTNDPKASASEFRLSRAEIERRGRSQAFIRAFWMFAFLFVLQLPPYLVATGRLDADGGLDAVVPARISLLIDVAMVGAYLMLAYRAQELVWSARARRGMRRLAGAMMFAVMVGGVMDLVEDGLLWFAVEGATDRADLTLSWSPYMRWPVMIGLSVLALLALVCRGKLAKRARAHEHKPQDVVTEGQVDERDLPGLVICCSGGGVRSASFCLGGLQVLTKEGIYADADVVIGVSGGGYIAAAHHTVRWRSSLEENPDDEGPGHWPQLPIDAFAPDSPEQRWMRRNSRFLLDSVQVAVQGTLSLLFGISTNIILIAAVLGAAAWWLGWFLVASGGLTGWKEETATSQFTGDIWRYVGFVWIVPLIGVGFFLLEKIIDRFVTPGFESRRRLRLCSMWFLFGGAGATSLLIGIPELLDWMHDFAAKSDSVFANLIHKLGFVPTEVCVERITARKSACGVSARELADMSLSEGKAEDAAGGAATARKVSAGSLAAVLAAVLAVVRAASSEKRSDRVSEGLRNLAGTVWNKSKNVVLPWAAAITVVTVLIVLLLRWVAALVKSPALLESWELAYVFGGLLLAVRVLTETNRTSLHHFYRERLSFAFLVRRRAGGVDPVRYKKPLRFSESTPPKGRGPRLVTCAVANVSDEGLVPAGRGCTPFVFDDRTIGLTDQLLPSGAALTPSSIYEYAADRRYRDATIPAAMAMSGAAFSPLAGRENVRVGPYRLVLALANARLGVWLPNPLWIDDVTVVQRLVKVRSGTEAIIGWNRLSRTDQRLLFEQYLRREDKAWLVLQVHTQRLDEDTTGATMPLPELPDWFTATEAGEGRAIVRANRAMAVVRSHFAKPGPYRLAKEAIGKTSIYDRKLYITDGGHYDNLGLIEALRRCPKEIIVLDASADPEDTFNALGRAIATARMDLDCEVTFDPRAMRRLKAGRAAAAWGSGTYEYANGGPTGTIHVAKAIMLEGLPWDIETYAASAPQFPRTSTANQLYGEFDLETYRVLGREVIARLLRL